jgi:hypothetical protein
LGSLSGFQIKVSLGIGFEKLSCPGLKRQKKGKKKTSWLKSFQTNPWQRKGIKKKKARFDLAFCGG